MNRQTFWVCILLIGGATIVGAIHADQPSQTEHHGARVELARIEAAKPLPPPPPPDLPPISERAACVESVMDKQYRGDEALRAMARSVEACMGASP